MQGHSIRVSIPKEVCKALLIENSTFMDIWLEDDRIVMAKSVLPAKQETVG